MSNAKTVRSLLYIVESLNRHADEQGRRYDAEGQAARRAADPGRTAAHWRAAAIAAMESNMSRNVAATLAVRVQEIRRQAA